MAFPPPVRRMHLDDLQDIATLIEAVAAEREWIKTEPGFDRQRYMNRWRSMIDEVSVAMFVAEVNGHVIGFADIYPDETHAHLLSMFVAKQHRGRGIGKALLEAILSWARERKLMVVRLYVFPHNKQAIGLYKSVGFHEALITGYAKR